MLETLANKRAVWSLGSLIVLLIFWHVAAELLQHRHLPTPVAVFETFLREVRSGDLIYHVWVTLIRVVISFIVAMLIGSAIGLVMGRMETVNRFFDSWLIFFLNLPALVIIVLCYVWFGLNDMAAIIAVAINKIPNVAVTVREGARALSRDLTEMAEIYSFGRTKTLRHVILPQMAPFFAAAARTGLSLIWKIVLVVELFGLSAGVGVRINEAYHLFDVPMILAYAIAFIVVVQLIEMFVLQPIEARVNRWRR